jgi:hypothetical protein
LHLIEFLTGLPSVLLQPIQVHILLRIWVNILLCNAKLGKFLTAQCANPEEHLAARSDDYLAA